MEISELYDEQAKRWRAHNQKLFGLTSVAYEASDEEVRKQLKKDEKKYWQEGTCDFKEELLSNEKRIAQRDLLFEDTFALAYNAKTNAVILLAQFLKSAALNGNQLGKTQLVELAECLRQLMRGEKNLQRKPQKSLKRTRLLKKQKRLGSKQPLAASSTQRIPSTTRKKRTLSLLPLRITAVKREPPLGRWLLLAIFPMRN